MSSRQLSISVLSCIVAAALVSCTTVPPPKPLSVQEQVQLDVAAGSKLLGRIEPVLPRKEEPELSRYLVGIGTRLSQSSLELRSAPLKVFLIDSLRSSWKSVAIPGNRVYVSIPLLKKAQFENEVAAILALELSHLVKRHSLRHIERVGAAALEDPFSDQGPFAFNLQEMLDSTASAVALLYSSGYDPRGLVTYWEVFRDHPESSPYSESAIEELLRKTRESIALYGPLRNPIVRSETFIKMERRIQKL